MTWPAEAFLNLRQIDTPNGNPQYGGNLLYVKTDGKLYTKDASGVETVLGDVTLKRRPEIPGVCVNPTSQVALMVVNAGASTLSWYAGSSLAAVSSFGSTHVFRAQGDIEVT